MTQNKPIGEKRIDVVDIVRAIGIVIMVAGHTPGFGGKFDRYIHTFHMPLFFLISGYLYRLKVDTSILRQIGQKAMRLLVPYAFYALINYIFWFLLEKDAPWYSPLVNLVTYNTHDLPICGALWFLSALFFAEVFYLLIDSVIRKKLIRTIFVTMCAVIAALVQNYTQIRLPLTIDIAIVCMFFLEVGQLVRIKGGNKLKLVKSWDERTILLLAMIMITINLVLAFVNPYVNLKSGWYGILPLFFINACVGTFGFVLVAIWIDRKLPINNKFRAWLVMVGRHSLIFMGLNQLVIFILQKICNSINFYFPKFILALILWIITLALLSIVSICVVRIKSNMFHILFGVK